MEDCKSRRGKLFDVIQVIKQKVNWQPYATGLLPNSSSHFQGLHLPKKQKLCHVLVQRCTCFSEVPFMASSLPQCIFGVRIARSELHDFRKTTGASEHPQGHGHPNQLLLTSPAWSTKLRLPSVLDGECLFSSS